MFKCTLDFQIKLDIEDSSCTVEHFIPILIGTIPLREAFIHMSTSALPDNNYQLQQSESGTAGLFLDSRISHNDLRKLPQANLLNHNMGDRI